MLGVTLEGATGFVEPSREMLGALQQRVAHLEEPSPAMMQVSPSPMERALGQTLRKLDRKLEKMEKR